MANELIRVGLQRIHDRLSDLANGDVRLSCWLIEWPSMWAANSDSDKPGFSDETMVWENVDWEGVDLELNRIVTDPGRNHEDIFGSDGKLLVCPVSVPNEDRAAWEPFRALHLSLPVSAKRDLRERDRLRRIFCDRLKPILVDAGNILMSMPADAIPIPTPLATVNPLEFWLFFIFDLAWAKIDGSSLRASMDKTYWYSDNAMEQYDPPREIPDPEGWYSVIDDVVQASLDAIDILLSMENGKALANDNHTTSEPIAIAQTTRWDNVKRWAGNNQFVVAFLVILVVVTSIATLVTGVETLRDWARHFIGWP